MHTLRPLLILHPKSAAAPRTQTVMAVLTAMLALVIALVSSAFPLPLMPGVFGAMALIVSIIAAGLAWLLSVERSPEQLTLWDVAEAFALIGIVALLLGRPDQALQYLGVPV